MATTEVLRVTPLYQGDCCLYYVENLTKGNCYQVDTIRRHCTCRQGEIFPGRTCKHLFECDEMEERQKQFRMSHPTAVARAKSRVTGQREVPRYQVLSEEENEALKMVFA